MCTQLINKQMQEDVGHWRYATTLIVIATPLALDILYSTDIDQNTMHEILNYLSKRMAMH